jgi:hypothetical protein
MINGAKLRIIFQTDARKRKKRKLFLKIGAFLAH